MEGTRLMVRLAQRPNPTNDYILVSKIRVDHTYQRGITPRWVQELVANWNETSAGIICVSLRKDGFYYVIDGQHRYAAAKELDIDLLPAEIWHRLVVPEEARMFVERNNTRGIRKIDKFLAAIKSGSPDQCEILKIAHAAGWEINDNQKQDGAIRAVAALERVYGASSDQTKTRRPDDLRSTLETVRRAWGLDKDGVSGYLLDGLGRFFIRYGDQIDGDILIRKLSKYAGGPLALVGRSRELQSFVRSTVPNCVAELIVETYNRGLRTNKLATWRT